MNAGQTTPLAAPPSGSTPAILVAALSPRDHELFFGDDLTAHPDLPGLQLLDPTGLTIAAWEDALRRLRPTCLLTGWSTPPLPDRWLTSPGCPLRYVCHITGSVRRLVPRSFLEAGGLVSNWGGNVGAQVAEHALLLALSALRNQAAWRAFIERPPGLRRIEELGTRTLFGRRVGLHGFGSVARALGRLLAPFEVRIMAYSAGVPSAVMRDAGIEPATSLEDLFRHSEVLFECEALTPPSAGSVTAAILSALPEGAVFVNVGRGAVVDDTALAAAARSGRIRVALDVVTDEPLTPRSPFWCAPGAVLSPHIGGPTSDLYRRCGELALNNLRHHLAGRMPEDLVDLAVYDRAT